MKVIGPHDPVMEEALSLIQDWQEHLERTLAHENDLCFIPREHGPGQRTHEQRVIWLKPDPINRERMGMVLYELIVTGQLDPYLSPRTQRALFRHTEDVGRLLWYTYALIGERIHLGLDPYSETERRRRWRRWRR